MCIRDSAVAAGSYHTVGLTLNGRVVAAGNNDDGQCDVRAWADIVAVAAGSRHTLGLKADGSVIATGCNDHGQTDVASWCALRSLESPLSSTD